MPRLMQAQTYPSGIQRWTARGRHAAAVALEPLRRPGRFSLLQYSRQAAMNRLSPSPRAVILNLGAGSRALSPSVIGVDLRPGPLVDVVADAMQLPFRQGVCDGVWMGGLLEHVEDTTAILRESSRVLKQGAWLYCETPFLYGQHDAPGDYRRWTMQGLRETFRSWDVEWVTDVSGPFSALAHQLRCCLAICTSFGSERLYSFLFEAVWGYVVWPIKFLDALFARYPCAKAHAAAYGIMVRKNSHRG